MTVFVLQNNNFEFNGELEQQTSGTVIGTKFTPTPASIFIEEIETKFLDTQEFKPWV